MTKTEELKISAALKILRGVSPPISSLTITNRNVIT